MKALNAIYVESNGMVYQSSSTKRLPWIGNRKAPILVRKLLVEQCKSDRELGNGRCFVLPTTRQGTYWQLVTRILFMSQDQHEDLAMYEYGPYSIRVTNSVKILNFGG